MDDRELAGRLDSIEAKNDMVLKALGYKYNEETGTYEEIRKK